MKNPWLIIVIGAIVILLIMDVLRVLSSEDDWICSGGQWVKHGNPTAPMPQTSCE